ncbi:MAG: hypothetical protein AAB729_00360 [Patescibacteria group bacterium]
MEPKDVKTLFEYFDGQFGEVKGEIHQLAQKVETLQTSVYNLTHMVKGFQEEMIFNRNRIDVLEKLARQVSEKVGIPLPF